MCMSLPASPEGWWCRNRGGFRVRLTFSGQGRSGHRHLWGTGLPPILGPSGTARLAAQWGESVSTPGGQLCDESPPERSLEHWRSHCRCRALFCTRWAGLGGQRVVAGRRARRWGRLHPRPGCAVPRRVEDVPRAPGSGYLARTQCLGVRRHPESRGPEPGQPRERLPAPRDARAGEACDADGGELPGLARRHGDPRRHPWWGPRPGARTGDVGSPRGRRPRRVVPRWRDLAAAHHGRPAAVGGQRHHVRLPDFDTRFTATGDDGTSTVDGPQVDVSGPKPHSTGLLHGGTVGCRPPAGR